VNDANANPALIQRVRIRIGLDLQPADISTIAMDVGDPTQSFMGSFTLEFFVRGVPEENPEGAGCVGGSTGWINCPIVVDRDVFGTPSFGDFGLSICNDGGVRAGIEGQSGGVGVCSGLADVLDGDWHHVALTRDGQTGNFCVFVDGVQGDCEVGPTGQVSYNDTRAPTSFTGQDPTLVLAAEKHGFGDPGFSGWLDEFRASRVVRYFPPCGDGNLCFTPPNAPFTPDGNTVGLYRFDDAPAGAPCSCAGPLLPLTAAGACVADASGVGPAVECRHGSTAGRFGPRYSAHSPFVADPDLDGFPGLLDNCPFAANASQTDARGFGAASGPDGNGDACQCGDADDDGDAGDADDLLRVRRTLAGLAPGVATLAKCSVAGGPTDCNLLDAAVLWRATEQRAPGIGEYCDAAVP
jgi:hypothetical protein